MLKLNSVFTCSHICAILWEVNILNSLHCYLNAAQKGVWQSQRPIEGDENEVMNFYKKKNMYRGECYKIKMAVQTVTVFSVSTDLSYINLFMLFIDI